MIHVDKREFKTKVNALAEEATTRELKNPAWVWMACGAFAGLVASCIKFHKPVVKPIVGAYTNMEEEENGSTEC